MIRKREHDDEPIPGLPGHLPEGEHILWRGSPDWTAFARRALHTRKVAVYFGLLMAWRLVSSLADGQPVGESAAYALWILPLALPCLAILFMLAWAMSWTTFYTITNRRIVLRFGVAIQKAFNIPFTSVGSAGLKVYANGTGDITLSLTGPDRIAYLHLWPHVRPWRYGKAEPMLRAIPDAEKAARVLSEALRDAVPGSADGATAGVINPTQKEKTKSGSQSAPSSFGDEGLPQPAAGR